MSQSRQPLAATAPERTPRGAQSRPRRAGCSPADGDSRDHRLWWRPGEHGKGILFDCGLVHTWPEGEGDHQHYIDRHFRRTGGRPRMIFHVRPTGEVRIPDDHLRDAADLTAVLTSADGRLRPFVAVAAGTPRRHELPATLSAGDREQWSFFQRRGRSLAA